MVGLEPTRVAPLASKTSMSAISSHPLYLPKTTYVVQVFYLISMAYLQLTGSGRSIEIPSTMAEKTSKITISYPADQSIQRILRSSYLPNGDVSKRNT